MRTAAGEFTRRIILRTLVRVEDEGGGWTETAVDVGPVPAKVEPLDGREQVEAMQAGMERPHRFMIRYREGLTGANEVVYMGRTFNVRSIVDPNEAHEDLVILADEVRA